MQAKSAGVKGVAQKSDTGQVVTGVKALINKEMFFECNRTIEPITETLL